MGTPNRLKKRRGGISRVQAIREIHQKQAAKNAKRKSSTKLQKVQKAISKSVKRLPQKDLSAEGYKTVYDALVGSVKETTPIDQNIPPLAIYAAGLSLLNDPTSLSNQTPVYLLAILRASLPHLSPASINHLLDQTADVCTKMISSSKDFTEDTIVARSFGLITAAIVRAITCSIEKLDSSTAAARIHLVLTKPFSILTTIGQNLLTSIDSKRSIALRVHQLRSKRRVFEALMQWLLKDLTSVHDCTRVGLLEALLERFDEIYLESFGDISKILIDATVKKELARELARDRVLELSRELERCLKALVGPLVVQVCLTFERGLSGHIEAKSRLFRFVEGLVCQSTTLFRASTPREGWFVAFRCLTVLLADCGLDVFKRRSGLTGILEGVPSLKSLVQILEKLRLSSSTDSEFTSAIDSTLVSIGRVIPVASLLAWIPLFTDGTESFPEWVPPGTSKHDSHLKLIQSRLFLFNVWRQVCDHDDLGIFTRCFLPLAKSFAKLSNGDGEVSDTSQFIVVSDDTSTDNMSSHLFALELQCWRLATGGFAKYPRMGLTEANLHDFASAVSRAINHPQVALTACYALTRLCRSLTEIASEHMGRSPDIFTSSPKENDEENDDFMLCDLRELASQPDGSSDGSFVPVSCAMLSEVDHPELDVGHYHGISQREAIDACRILRSFSSKLMPRLSNAVQKLGLSATLMDALEAYAVLCEPDVLRELFSQRISPIQNKAHMALSLPEWNVMLDVGISLIHHLPDEDVVKYIRIVLLPTLCSLEVVNDPASVKRGYKILEVLFIHRQAILMPFLPDIRALFQETTLSVPPSAIKYRLRCLHWIIDLTKMELANQREEILIKMFDFVDEVVLRLADSSSKIRQASIDALDRLIRYTNEPYNIVSSNIPSPSRQLFHRVMFGLLGDSTANTTAALTACAKFLWSAHEQYDKADIEALLDTVSTLILHNTAEVMSAAIRIIRVSLKLTHRSPVIRSILLTGDTPVLANVLENIDVVLKDAPQANPVPSVIRRRMRQLVESIIKHFGGEVTIQLCLLRIPAPKQPLDFRTGIPRAERRGVVSFVQYILKQMRRHERLKQERSSEDQPSSHMKRVEHIANSALGGELDLLDQSLAMHFIADEPAVSDSDNDEDGVTEPWSVQMTRDGRIEILSREEKKLKEKKDSRTVRTKRLLQRLGRARHQGKMKPNFSTQPLGNPSKRQRDSDLEDFENEELIRLHEVQEPDISLYDEQPKPLPTRGTLKRRQQQAARKEGRKRRLEADIRTGEEFRPRAPGTGGDMKRGNMTPYAYVPLNRAALNRRSSVNRSSQGRFDFHSKRSKAKHQARQKR